MLWYFQCDDYLLFISFGFFYASRIMSSIPAHLPESRAGIGMKRYTPFCVNPSHPFQLIADGTAFRLCAGG